MAWFDLGFCYLQNKRVLTQASILQEPHIELQERIRGRPDNSHTGGEDSLVEVSPGWNEKDEKELTRLRIGSGVEKSVFQVESVTPVMGLSQERVRLIQGSRIRGVLLEGREQSTGGFQYCRTLQPELGNNLKFNNQHAVCKHSSITCCPEISL